MPDSLFHDPSRDELRVGSGVVAGVTGAMWGYETSGVEVIPKWFSYRRRSRGRPVIGDRRVSALTDIQPSTWLPEYTAELIDLLNVLGLLVELEPAQAELLDQVLTGPLLDVTKLADAIGPEPKAGNRRTGGRPTDDAQHTLDIAAY